MIESCSFGEIRVRGTTYRADLIILPDRIVSNWWRKEGHELHMEDLEEVMREKPDVLIIGTGQAGAMAVPPDVIRSLQKAGIKPIVKTTPEACKTYNEVCDREKAAAALHLTC
jgi:hypothetical protein